MLVLLAGQATDWQPLQAGMIDKPLQAAAQLTAKHLANIVLLGNKEAVEGLARKANADISQAST